MVILECPNQNNLTVFRRSPGTFVGRECPCVALVRQYPHAITAVLDRQYTKSVDKRSPNSLSSKEFVDAELVKEHLGSLVRMCHLDAAHEPNRVALYIGDVEVMVFFSKKPSSSRLLSRSVKQLRCSHHSVKVTGVELPDLHPTIMALDARIPSELTWWVKSFRSP